MNKSTDGQVTTTRVEQQFEEVTMEIPVGSSSDNIYKATGHLSSTHKMTSVTVRANGDLVMIFTKNYPRANA